MTRRTLAIVALVVSLATPAWSQTRPLEELIEGRFTASGINRVQPGQAAHRMLCRLTGRRLDARRMSLSGRCAAADQTADVTMAFTVEEPARRYALRIEMKMSATQGYERAYDYRGAAGESGFVFTAPFTLSGKDYRSTFQVTVRGGDVVRIVETVEAVETGVKTVLLDLATTRE